MKDVYDESQGRRDTRANMDAADSSQAGRSDGKRGLGTGREPEKKPPGGDRAMERTSEYEAM